MFEPFVHVVFTFLTIHFVNEGFVQQAPLMITFLLELVPALISLLATAVVWCDG